MDRYIFGQLILRSFARILYIIWQNKQKIEINIFCLYMYPTTQHLYYLQNNTTNMEKRINDQLKQYLSKFKDEIRDKIVELGLGEMDSINELLEFVYEYERLTFEKEDFMKRRRVKNSVPMENRCNAKRANGEQCTRKRRDDCEFCGTHYKGTPHGIASNDSASSSSTSNEAVTLEVFAEEIGGIVYYIDKFKNVYKTDDVLQAKLNPSIIAKWEKTGDKYSIPEFGLI